jgi:hypothetical protein
MTDNISPEKTPNLTFVGTRCAPHTSKLGVYGSHMGIEIERKFLVTGAAWRQAAGVRFSRGYLNRDKERTVRVRLAGEKHSSPSREYL